MHSDDQIEFAVRVGMPFANFLGSYAVGLIGADFFLEYLSVGRKVEDPKFVFLTALIFLAVYGYGLYYSKEKLNYFCKKKVMQHGLILIIIPSSLGIVSSLFS